MKPTVLRKKIITSLKVQGFAVNGSVQPRGISKKTIRRIQQHSRKEQIVIHANFIQEAYHEVSKYLVDGRSIDPEKIQLELREVQGETTEEIIFKWWNLVWWSVPYQRAYGRQMRFILWDKFHNAPFGLIGLQSPVLQMAVRDNYLQIPQDELDYWINKSLQAQRLGALPPYNQLLGGKMVGLTVASNEIRKAYAKKYTGRTTILERRKLKPELLFVTTTSAFGKSSIYNRLKYYDDTIAVSLGYTAGSGSFHIPEDLYNMIKTFLRERNENAETTFGNGPSRKMKVLDKAFRLLKLPDYKYHNIKREFFLFPHAKNINEVIQHGKSPRYHNRSISELQKYWLCRWALPRAERFPNWKEFDSQKFLISVKRNITRWSK